MTNKNSSVSNNPITWIVPLLLILALIVLYFMGYGPYCEKCKIGGVNAVASNMEAPLAPAMAAAGQMDGAATPEPEAAANVVAANVVAANVVSDTSNPVTASAEAPKVTIYFGLARTAFPPKGTVKLGPLVEYLKANPSAKVDVSGFHDKTGSPEINDKISFDRALAVKAELVRLGIADDRINLAKPQITTGTGDDAEARRVEVTVAQ